MRDHGADNPAGGGAHHAVGNPAPPDGEPSPRLAHSVMAGKYDLDRAEATLIAGDMLIEFVEEPLNAARLVFEGLAQLSERALHAAAFFWHKRLP
ncbi:MAG: hypothetical protein ACHQC9_03150 [Alphaproteobacteria bacterium]